MLSLKKGIPICKIIGGVHNNKIIRITDEVDKNDNIENDIFDILEEDKIRRYKKYMSVDEVEEIKESIINNVQPLDRKLIDIVKKVKEELKKRENKELHIQEGELYIMPPGRDKDRQRLVIYLAGPSGSGKSTTMGKYMSLYNQMFPKNNIVIFSSVNEDKAFDKYDVKRININEKLLLNKIDITKELCNSLVVFDDIDVIKGSTELKKYIRELRDEILETGRHCNIDVLCNSHQLLNYKATRNCLNESHFVVFYPKSGSTMHIKRLLKDYIGCSNDQIDRILNLPSRWVAVKKTAPQAIIYSQGIFLLN